MRTTIEDEVEDREVTLGLPSLLGIFFGLAVLCGVLFGVGYSMGKHTAQAPASSSASTSGHQMAPANSPAPRADSSSASIDETSAESASSPSQPAVVTRKPAAATRAVEENTAPSPSPSQTIRQPSAGSQMVQIAAVSHREDAQILVSALRQRGYKVSIRAEPQDKLLHIQVGPFATREAAKAIRARLLASGYNAIIKP